MQEQQELIEEQHKQIESHIDKIKVLQELLATTEDQVEELERKREINERLARWSGYAIVVGGVYYLIQVLVILKIFDLLSWVYSKACQILKCMPIQ